jgi:hypothetical protein
VLSAGSIVLDRLKELHAILLESYNRIKKTENGTEIL